MTASETMTDASPGTPALRPVRPFLWSVRRELWENHAIWIAPLAVAALVIFGSLLAVVASHGGRTVHRMPAVASSSAPETAAQGDTVTLRQSTPDGSIEVQKTIKVPAAPTPEQRRAMATIPFYMVAGLMILTMFLVAVFYCLGGLYNERRDRSILFWKSLPVRDLTTVLSKVVVPMVVLPAVTLVVALGTQLLMMAIGVLAFSSRAKGADADVSIPLADIMAVTAYGLVALTLWWAPVYAWLLLISGWAKRTPFLWAVLPPLGLAVAEKIAFGTNYIGHLILSRLGGAGEQAFIVPKHVTSMPSLGIDKIDAAKFAASPGLWFGLLAAAGMIAAAVWLRRRREPV